MIAASADECAPLEFELYPLRHRKLPSLVYSYGASEYPWENVAMPKMEVVSQPPPHSTMFGIIFFDIETLYPPRLSSEVATIELFSM